MDDVELTSQWALYVEVAEVDQWHRQDQWHRRRPDFDYAQRAMYTEDTSNAPWTRRTRVRSELFQSDGTRWRVAPEIKSANKRKHNTRNRAAQKERYTVYDVELTSQWAIHGSQCPQVGRWE